MGRSVGIQCIPTKSPGQSEEASRNPGLTQEPRTLTPLCGRWLWGLLGGLIKDSLCSWLPTSGAAASGARSNPSPGSVLSSTLASCPCLSICITNAHNTEFLRFERQLASTSWMLMSGNIWKKAKVTAGPSENNGNTLIRKIRCGRACGRKYGCQASFWRPCAKAGSESGRNSRGAIE